MRKIEYNIDNNGCWVWQLSFYPNGYGRIWRNKKHHLSHRWYYEQKNGPITQELVIDHLCRNKACVNPDHLDLVTQKENCRRGIRGKRAKLTGEQVIIIRKRLEKESLRAVAKDYKMSFTNMAEIKHRRTWKEI